MESSTNISGAGWGGLAERTSIDDANNYEFGDVDAHGTKAQNAGNNMASTDGAVQSSWIQPSLREPPDNEKSFLQLPSVY